MKRAGRKQASKAFKPKYEFKATEESIVAPKENPKMKEMLKKLEECTSKDIDVVFSSFMGSNSLNFKKSYKCSRKSKGNPKMTSYQKISKNKNAISFDFSEEDQEIDYLEKEKKLPNIAIDTAEAPANHTSDEIKTIS